MFKRQTVNPQSHSSNRKFVVLASCMMATLFGAVSSQAANNSDLDYVLTELSRQHNNASPLVKSARQPASLALDSQILSKSANVNNSNTDVLGRLSAVASTTVSKFSQTGVASWYGRQFHGKKTASGEIFDQNGLTASHRTLPLNCYVKVTNKANGKSVIVKVNDRGPFTSSRVMDLSYGAAKQIGIVNAGSGNVIIERVDNPN